MQYHYVIGYDTELKKWFVESDTTAHFVDGNVWDQKQAEVEFIGWKVPKEGSSEEALDFELFRTLQYIVDTIPVPQEV
jgi:hypothetical protein